MSTEAYVPRRVPVLTEAMISHDWDIWLQALRTDLDSLLGTILSGPDADPNGIVVGSPGDLYRQVGVATSQLFVKESGIQTDTGWVGK